MRSGVMAGGPSNWVRLRAVTDGPSNRVRPRNRGCQCREERGLHSELHANGRYKDASGIMTIDDATAGHGKSCFVLRRRESSGAPMYSIAHADES